MRIFQILALKFALLNFYCQSKATTSTKLAMLLLLLLLLSLLELHPLAKETPFALFESGKVKRMMKTLK